jgi:predicted transcriptional regulator
MTIRLPDETLAALDAIGRVVKRPMWRVMVDAVAAYCGDGEALSESDRRLARALLRREP